MTRRYDAAALCMRDRKGLDGEMEVVSGLLLDEARRFDPDGPRLVLGGEAALTDALLRQGGDVSWIPTDIRELRQAPKNVVVSDAFQKNAYVLILLPVPADRGLARRWLLTARDALVPGGVLIVAGANSEGAKSVIADAGKIFGSPVASGYRQKHRTSSFIWSGETADPPSWTSAEGIVPGTWQSFEVGVGDDVLTLETTPGVFAGNRLDAGTRLLLDHLEVEPETRVLDVGCGAGVIGIRASRLGAAHVDLVDANLLAIQAADRNLRQLGVTGRAMASNVYDAVAGQRYDLIVSNPPFHRGKQVDLSVADRIIEEAPKHLRPDGRILIVANAFLAYGKGMQRVFRHVEKVAETRQYHVLAASDPR